MDERFLDSAQTYLREGERLDDLQRRGFRIIQRSDVFRFGTDTVLLADFAQPRRGEKAVDLGCGTGAIALIMLAHRDDITVDGVEIQADVADMARRSAAINGVRDKFRVYNADMRNCHELLGRGKYSLAVCNPPYFKAGGALLSAGEKRRIARHEGDISPADIAASAAQLIKNGGRFAVIYPAPRALEMLRAMEDSAIAPKRIRTVHGVAGRAPKHVLIDGIRGAAPGLHWQPPLVLMNADGSYTEEWHRIYD
jgi:tRNA1Val (adenine37-N6)-methyltransferase